MDKVLLKEIIKDFEKISKVVNFRLKQLYQLLDEKPERAAANHEASKSDIKETIEQQRREMMAQVEEMRRQAMAQVKKSISSVQGMSGMPNMGMPNMGMPGGTPHTPTTPEEIEALRKKIESGMKVEQETLKVVEEESNNDG